MMTLQKTTGYIITIIMLTGLMVASCEKGKEWVNEPEPEGEASYQLYLESVNEMDKLMNGSYASALGFGGNGLAGAPLTISSLCADFVGPYSPRYGDIQGSGWWNYYQRRNNNMDWGDHTRLLQYGSNATNIANLLIREIESGEHDNEPGFKVTGHRILGEAYCMRALINFEYTKYFGPQYHSSTKNEPAWLYRKEFLNSLEGTTKGRETVEDSYKQLISDCKNAIKYLPKNVDSTKHSPRYNANRFHRDFARALLAKIYWQKLDYDKCKTEINKLLGPVKEPSEELKHYPLEDSNRYPEAVYWNKDINTYGPDRDGELIFSFDGSCGTTPMAQNPRLYNFVPNDQADPNSKSRSEMRPSGEASYTMSTYFEHYVEFDKKNDLRYQELIDPIKGENDTTYWWPLKYTKQQGINLVWFRSAEFVLMRAEINARNGNLSDAKKDLNKIRMRAGLNKINSFTNQKDAVKTIIQERARELFLEKYRLWELLRLGATAENQNILDPGEIGYTAIGNGDRLYKPADKAPIDAKYYGGDILEWDDKYWAFPMPTNEYRFNDAL